MERLATSKLQIWALQGDKSLLHSGDNAIVNDNGSGNIICCCRLLGKNERADSLVGTAEYLAPEVINGEEYGYR